MRDEYISYEYWTEKDKEEFGVPMSVNLKTFFPRTHFFFNFGAEVIFFEDEIDSELVFDLGFWF